jgi:hypothetical protein
VGVQTVEHVKAMPNALRISLSKDDIKSIQEAAKFTPLFPMTFLFSYGASKQYNLGVTAEDVSQVHMATHIQAPPRPLVSTRCNILMLLILICIAISAFQRGMRHEACGMSSDFRCKTACLDLKLILRCHVVLEDTANI